ncbi:hypothetical protein L6164_002982 [Bauhinia variegata]|uniref:Uncharacterized protein n=1 Tax=Bauhinia variegata TaxID=167791 RepID=A0ACB9PZT3_BAUVA|nr:hypothetical protein L6164_002982 [Bauhinia variegata]
MDSESLARRPHCLLLPFPALGHLNPMFQFLKRLKHEGVRVTLVIPRFFCKKLHEIPTSIALEYISDGFDNGGFEEAKSGKVYFESFRRVGKETLCELIEKLDRSGNSVDCIVYDSHLCWVLEVAKRFGIVGASFLAQNLAVDSLYYHVKKGNLHIPLIEQSISLPGLPSLQPKDLPSFLYDHESSPDVLDYVLDQFSNIEEADWILCNSIYELETEVAEWFTKILPKLRTIGPTIPSMFLDKRLEDDKDYGCALFKSEECIKWLDERRKGSVCYISFGSMATLNEEQMEEIVCALRDSDCYFLWVVRTTEECKLPKYFVKNSEKGLIITWCPQLQVLAHEAVGCFVTHCGWNSTMEALSLGVPMVAMPQWTDQTTNAYYITDVLKMGLRAPADEKGIVRGESLKHCIKEMMETENGKEMKKNALNWKTLATKAVDEGGSSIKYISEFVNSLSTSGAHRVIPFN